MDNNNEIPRPANAQDKNVEAQVIAVDFAEPLSRDAPVDAAFDIVLSLREASGETHTWRGEVSNAYGRGNNASKTRAQMTLEALAIVGYNNPDLSQIETELVNKVIPISVKWSFYEAKGQWYKNVFLGHGGLRKIDKSKALDIMKKIGGAISGTPAPAAFGATPTAPSSPFAFR